MGGPEVQSSRVDEPPSMDLKPSQRGLSLTGVSSGRPGSPPENPLWVNPETPKWSPAVWGTSWHRRKRRSFEYQRGKWPTGSRTERTLYSQIVQREKEHILILPGNRLRQNPKNPKSISSEHLQHLNSLHECAVHRANQGVGWESILSWKNQSM